jgi:protein SCO1/2
MTVVTPNVGLDGGTNDRTLRHLRIQIFAALFLLALAMTVQASVDRREVSWDQRAGAQLPLQLQFLDEHNRTVRLGDYFGRRPVVLVMMYFSCPELCPLVLQGTQESLRNTGLVPGRDYELLAVSIDPRDTPAHAWAEKAHRMGASTMVGAVHFLTSPNNSAAELARVIGFHYAYDAEHGQFAHPAGFLIASPHGQISRYFFGVRYPAADVRADLINAAHGQIADLTDRVLMLCFHFDPTLGRHSLAIMDILRVLGAAALLVGVLGWWRLTTTVRPFSERLSRIRRGERR